MKTSPCLRTVAVVLGLNLLVASHLQAALVLGFDFQTGTPINASGTVQQVYQANFGIGSLYMNGGYGSSVWNPSTTLTNGYNHLNEPITDFNPSQLSSQSGTALNAGPGFNTAAPNPSSIAFRQTAAATNNGTNANGYSAVFHFSMAGYGNLIISYAAIRQNNHAFRDHQWDYSTNGVDWYGIDTASQTTWNEWNAFELSPTLGLNDATNAYVRLTFLGASVNPSSGSSVRMDNLQFNASSIPEPGASLLFVLAGTMIMFSQRRR